MKGRPGKPEALDQLQGRPGRRGAAAPAQTADAAASPDPSEDFFSSASPRDPWLPAPWLPSQAQAIWQRELEPARRQAHLKQSQLPLFALYCDALCRLERYTAELAASGSTYTTPSGYRRLAPEVGLRDKAAAEVKSLAAELMLSPKSWTSGMGTFVGRQLELFDEHRGAAATAAAAKPDSADALTTYLAGAPAVH
jgi:phage terminase small subunit